MTELNYLRAKKGENMAKPQIVKEDDAIPGLYSYTIEATPHYDMTYTSIKEKTSTTPLPTHDIITLSPSQYQQIIDDITAKLEAKLIHGNDMQNHKIYDDEEAETAIIEYIIKSQSSGKRKISLMELEYELCISEEQAERVMKNLKHSGVEEVA